MPSKARSKSSEKKAGGGSASRSRSRSKNRKEAGEKGTPRSRPTSKSRKSGASKVASPVAASTPSDKPSSTPSGGGGVVERKSRSEKKVTMVDGADSTTVKTVTKSSRVETRTTTSSFKLSDSRSSKALTNLRSDPSWLQNIQLLLGVAFFVALPFYVNLSCDKKQCTFMKLPKISWKRKDWFCPITFGTIIGWITMHYLVAMIPYGRIVEYGKLKYRGNGLLHLLATLIAIGANSYFKTPTTYWMPHWNQLMVAGSVLAFIASFRMAFASRKTPRSQYAPYANGGRMNDWFFGRDLNLTIFGVNVKWTYVMICFMGWLWNNSMIVGHDVITNKTWPNYALLAVFVFQASYILDIIVYEEGMSTTAEIRMTAPGYFFITGCLNFLPWIYCQQLRYLHFYPPATNWFLLGSAILLHTLGYYIMRASNGQKHEFRKNPYGAMSAALPSIPTPDGRRLLCGGWWGFVQHPNYLGDLMMAFAWSLPCGFSHFYPWLYPAMIVPFFLLKCRMDRDFCLKKHGAAYEKYMERVKYKLIPYIY